MPKPIVSHNNVKEKLQNVVRLLDIPKFWGPLATIIFTIVYHLASVYFGFTIAVMPLVVFLAAGAFVGGLRAGFVCAAWISLYSLYAIPELDRVVQIAIGTFGIAYVIGWQSRHIRQMHKSIDELVNGNVEKSKKALDTARDLIKHWGMYTDAGRLWQVRLFEDALGNVLAGIVGYRHIRQEIDQVQNWASDPENVKRWQQMEEAKAKDV